MYRYFCTIVVHRARAGGAMLLRSPDVPRLGAFHARNKYWHASC